MRRPGLGLEGSALGSEQQRAAPALPRRHTLRFALSAQGPLASPRSWWSRRSRHPRLGSCACTQAAVWEQPLPGFPGSERGCQRRGGGSGGGRTEKRTPGSSPPAPPAQRAPLCPSPAPSASAVTQAAREGSGGEGRGCRRAGAGCGGGRRRAGGSQSHPSRWAGVRSNLGPGGQRNSVGGGP